MSADRPNRRRSRRPFEALWLAVYLLGMFAASLHYGLVGHRVCEHGEVAHVEAAHHGNGSTGASACEAAPLQGAWDVHAPLSDEPSAPTPEDDTHEHCELDPTTQPADPVDVAPIAFHAFLEEHFESPAPSVPQPPSIAILRQAPGRSPPSV